ncbi:TAP-like protein [Nonomuraea solani]|uniref:TAP-like protein n=1 Tax=Nonomuraea solani TaxID=1144553 RepID=A0A1H6F0N3_9ACTN|nr:alpha/beta fold hydrolase [Nonomuraea solani]SEH02719.1 TAP-like protein [Nonomuraea solani]
MIRTLLALTVLTTPAPAAAEELQWTACPGQSALRCADLPVALAPGSTRKLNLKMARLPATGTRKGSVLINFGGPQGGQIAALGARPQIFAKIRESMDVITWDPRGYPGLSTPVLNCDWGLVRTPDRVPADQAAFDRLAAENRARADKCRSTDPGLFDHMDSASDARDADAIRRALGEKEMNFIGTSYGGTIAQAYARQFPERVRTIYIDGTGNHSPRDWQRELDALARDYEPLMDRFFEQGGPELERRWRALVAAADKKPIPAPKVNAAYTGAQLRMLLFQQVRWDSSNYARLTAAIGEAERGDASNFAASEKNPYPGLSGGGVKECLDFPRPTGPKQVARTVKRLDKVAPNLGGVFPLAWHLPLTCAGWPAPVSNPPKPLPRTLPPLLGAGTWLDFGGTSRVAAQVPGSRMIKFDGPGHNLFAAMANPCVIDHVSRYVTTGALPAGDTPSSKGTSCST